MKLTTERAPEALEELLAWSWHNSGAADLVADERRSENSAEIACTVLTEFGAKPEKIPTAIMVGNRNAIAQMQLGTPVADWPAMAYTIGRHPADGGDAHYVVFTDTHYVDLSFEQFHRPERHMEITSPVALPFTNLNAAKDNVGRDSYETGWDDGVWFSATVWPPEDFTSSEFTPWDSIDEACGRLIDYMTKFR